MNTATFKIYKFYSEMHGYGQTDFLDDDENEYIPDHNDIKEYITFMVEEYTDDYDEDYYSIFYTAKDTIDWFKISLKFKEVYNITKKFNT